MYAPKVPKSESPDKSLYTIYHCHNTIEPVVWNNRTDYYRIFSIDPGRRNFCFRVERRDLITGNITMELYEKIDLIGSKNDTRVIIDYVYRNVIDILEKYKNIIIGCHLVIIERQLHINYKMVRFSQHVITCLMMMLKNNSIKTVIMEISPLLKTKQFGVRGKLGKKEVKDWSIEKAHELLTSREDIRSLDILKKAKSKKDDLADTVVQIEAVFNLFELPCTQIKSSAELIVNPNQTQLYNPNNSIGVNLHNFMNSPVHMDINQIKFNFNMDLSKLDLSKLDFKK